MIVFIPSPWISTRFQKGPPLRFVVDGANVAYMNQNYVGGGFSYDQIDQLVTHLAEEYCASWQEILLLMPQVRVRPTN
eukprot:1180636-Prorocentrum_minimum.AAC.5